MEFSQISSYTTSMEETAQIEQEIRDKIAQNLQTAGHETESVIPATETPLEIAEQMVDLGGKSEGDTPSKSFENLGESRARKMANKLGQILGFKK